MITVERKAYLISSSTHYIVVRNGATYYVSDNYGHGFGVQQRYTKRNGTSGQRRLPEGKLRDELIDAVRQHAPLRERLCTPATVEQAGAMLANT